MKFRGIQMPNLVKAKKIRTESKCCSSARCSEAAERMASGTVPVAAPTARRRMHARLLVNRQYPMLPHVFRFCRARMHCIDLCAASTSARSRCARSVHRPNLGRSLQFCRNAFDQRSGTLPAKSHLEDSALMRKKVIFVVKVVIDT